VIDGFFLLLMDPFGLPLEEELEENSNKNAQREACAEIIVKPDAAPVIPAEVRWIYIFIFQ
jgi:hypothetical protein